MSRPNTDPYRNKLLEDTACLVKQAIYACGNYTLDSYADPSEGKPNDASREGKPLKEATREETRDEEAKRDEARDEEATREEARDVEATREETGQRKKVEHIPNLLLILYP